VLDIEGFIENHPGGRFVMKHNIGRDISKFFYGGYCLEGNLTGIQNGHVHSNYARKIVNDLIAAQLNRKEPIQSTICTVDKKHTVNSTTMTLYLKSVESGVVPNFKRYYPGLSMIGKHFTVRSLENKKVTRHYTVSNAMRPEFIHELSKQLSDEVSRSSLNLGS
jgi:hypothetical protein